MAYMARKSPGGGTGGTVAILGHRDAYGAFRRVVERYTKIRHHEPYVFEGSSMGADSFGVQVFFRIGERKTN